MTHLSGLGIVNTFQNFSRGRIAMDAVLGSHESNISGFFERIKLFLKKIEKRLDNPKLIHYIIDKWR